MNSIANQISTVIERVTKSKKLAIKKMKPNDFLTWALEEMRKVGSDESEGARNRLACLKKAVDSALTQISKADDENINIEVETAWAPEKSGGEKVMDLTVTQDQSAVEISPQALAASSTNKTLAKLEKELDTLKGPVRKKAKKEDSATWPEDMNTPAFRKGKTKAEQKLTWGEDPASLSEVDGEQNRFGA